MWTAHLPQPYLCAREWVRVGNGLARLVTQAGREDQFLLHRIFPLISWSSCGETGWLGGSLTWNYHVLAKKKKSSIHSGSAHVEWPQTPADSEFLIPFTSASPEQNLSWDFPQNPASKIALGFFWLTNWPDLITEQWSQETWGMCGIGCGIYGTFFGMTRIKAIPIS